MSFVLIQFSVEAYFMNAKHNLDFPNYIPLYFFILLLILFSKETHKNA